MKKIFSAILIASCCAFIALPAQAQVKWGIKGGLNMTKIDWNKLEKNKDNMAGFFIGPMAEFTLPVVGLGIDAAVLFSQKGIKAENDGAKQLGLDIPVNLKYNIGLGSMLGIFIAAGPDFYFDFKGDENSIEKKKAKVSVNVGAGLKLFKHLQLVLGYAIPLGNQFKYNDATAAIIKGKDKTWQVSVAYMF